MNIRHISSALLFSAAVVLPLPSVAQVPSFNASIDCGGVFSPGAAVPFTIRLENQLVANINLDINATLSVPGRQPRTLLQRAFILGANQDVAINRQVNLPRLAPNGDYSMAVTASSATETAFDTCSFNVQ